MGELRVEGGDDQTKPHLVVIPCPLQGHIKTILKLTILYYRGFEITFVNTEFNHNRFLESGGFHALDGLPDFRFETIPDGLPPSDVTDASQDIPSLCYALMNNMLSPFVELVARLNEQKPVTCILSDPFTPFTVAAGRELGLPVVMFVTMGACGFMGFKQLLPLKEKGFFPLKDESYLSNGYLETTVDWVPGMKDIRLKDLPSFLRTTDPNEIGFHFRMGIAETAVYSQALGVHTFEALEPDALVVCSSVFPPVYAIGPLQLLLDQIPAEKDTLKSIGYSLWKEEAECLQWLESKEPGSVVYVNFGSITVMTGEQLIEFAMGLANSKQSFLWVIRPDLVMGATTILAAEFAEGVKENGFVTSWCPQEDVLNHPSVGGFLTHSGWGSTIESLSAGVPMVCWPFFADQPMNCRYACKEWGVGMEIESDAKRDEVEELVRELMNGEKGKMMREKALEWKKLAEEAANGSSSINLMRYCRYLIMIHIVHYDKITLGRHDIKSRIYIVETFLKTKNHLVFALIVHEIWHLWAKGTLKLQFPMYCSFWEVEK